MSHTVTITRTTTTSSGTAVFVNTGYATTTPGLLRIAQLLLGAVCVGLVGWYFDHQDSYYSRVSHKPELFFFIMAVACLVGTFCIVLSCFISLSTASLLSKTMFDVVYHSVAFLLYLAAGLTLIIEVNHQKNNYGKLYEPFLAASVIGLVVAALYLVSAILANRAYRGI